MAWIQGRAGARRFPAGRRGHDLRRRISELDTHERALAELAAAVENKFLALGAALQEQAALSGQLVRKGRTLLEGAAGDGPGGDPVRAALELIRQTLDFTHEGSRRIEALLVRMDRYHEQTGRLLKEEQRVERILAPLRIIQTLFRIESAVLPADVQTAFATLSGEIPKYDVRVREVFAQHPSRLLRYDLINGLPGFVTLEADGMIQSTALDIRDGRIVAIYVVRNPDKLRHLEATLN